ncbi:MAG: GntR family transcriptional regulator [Kiritimatiellae bacterium]|nr:GntR family transcriptional regulator [Kiritimatiellia bacterium]
MPVSVKHEMISDQIVERIRRGVYHARIPGARVLAGQFQVDLKTANKAVNTLVARGLLERRTGKGTFLVKRVSTARTHLALAFYKFASARDPVFADLFAGANDAAKQCDGVLELTYPGIGEDRAKMWRRGTVETYRAQFLDQVTRGAPKGILYCGVADPHVLEQLRQVAPIMQVAAFGVQDENFVRRDPVDGIRRAANALFEAGRRRIAFATYAGKGPDLTEKAEGYRCVLAELGLHFQAEFVTRYPARSNWVEKILSHDPAPDACLCSESTIGRALLEGFAERGNQIPSDFALWSFDDGNTGEYTFPRMSGIRVFDAEIGRLAVERLVELIEGRRPQPLRETLPAVLVPRTSG